MLATGLKICSRSGKIRRLSVELWLHDRNRNVASDNRAGEEVVVSRPLAERIQVDIAACVARKRVAAAFTEQRAKTQLVGTLGR
jgi:hypothetical protein